MSINGRRALISFFASLFVLLPLACSLSLPPANLPRGDGYGIWHPEPNRNECSKTIHDSFWVKGPDGKVYSTWHPPTYTDPATGKTCYFGHEHGDDPKTSSVFGNEPIPFGYVNDVFAAERKGAGGREEDHVGHKIQVQNNIKTYLGNNKRGKLVATCNAVLKVHMGVHSNDAFVNNLHEVFLFLRCDDGRHMRLKYLNAFGIPGQCSIVDQCPPRVFETVRPDLSLLPFSPKDSRAGDGARKLIDRRCVEKYWLKPNGQTTNWAGNNGEHWTIGVSGSMFKDGKQLFNFFFNPYLTVHDPARFFDPNNRQKNSYPPLLVGYAADQCFLNSALKARGPECDKLINANKRPPYAWNATESSFKGVRRSFSPNRIGIMNTSPVKTFYSNALLESSSFSTTRFANSIEQYLDGNVGNNDADIFMDTKNYDAPGVHAPN
jgi:hypothetical protein